MNTNESEQKKLLGNQESAAGKAPEQVEVEIEEMEKNTITTEKLARDRSYFIVRNVQETEKDLLITIDILRGPKNVQWITDSEVIRDHIGKLDPKKVSRIRVRVDRDRNDYYDFDDDSYKEEE